MVDQENKFNIFGKVDEDAERTKVYQQYVIKFPLGKGTCKELWDGIEAMNAEIAQLEYKKVNSGGKGSIEARQIDGIARRKVEFEKYYAQGDCKEALKAAESQVFFDQQLGLMDKAKSLTTAASSTTKYIVFGMLGLVVIFAGFIIIKKMNK